MLLLLQKVGSGCSPLKSQWRGQADEEECLLSFGCQQPEWGEDEHLSKSWPLPPESQGARLFIHRERGLHAETDQSALTVVLKFVISLTSITLTVWGMIHLQFQLQSQFVTISLSPLLEIVAAYVMTTVWPSYS